MIGGAGYQPHKDEFTISVYNTDDMPSVNYADDGRSCYFIHFEFTANTHIFSKIFSDADFALIFISCTAYTCTFKMRWGFYFRYTYFHCLHTCFRYRDDSLFATSSNDRDISSRMLPTESIMRNKMTALPKRVWPIKALRLILNSNMHIAAIMMILLLVKFLHSPKYD